MKFFYTTNVRMTTTNMRWATIAVVVAVAVIQVGDAIGEHPTSERQIALKVNQDRLLTKAKQIALIIDLKKPGTISEWNRALVSKNTYFKELQQDVANTAEDDIENILNILDECKDASAECDIDHLTDVIDFVQVVYNDMSVQQKLLLQSVAIHKELAKSPDKLETQAAQAEANGPTGEGAVVLGMLAAAAGTAAAFSTGGAALVFVPLFSGFLGSVAGHHAEKHDISKMKGGAAALKESLGENKAEYIEGDLVSLKSELNKALPKMQKAFRQIETKQRSGASEEAVIKKVADRWKSIHRSHYKKIKDFQGKLLVTLKEYRRYIE